MNSSKNPRIAYVDRKGWYLWLAAFSLIMAFAITVHVLHMQVLNILIENGDGDLWLRNGYYTGVGLSGLVIVFILYTAFKQVQLHSLRNSLADEESELGDVQARLSELSDLFQLATSLNLQISVDTIIGLIVRRVVATLRAQQASIMLYNPKTELLETRAYYGVEGEYASDAKIRLGEGIAGWVAERLQGVLLNDRPPHPEISKFYKPHRHITSALSVPLRVEDKVVGVLNVNRISHPEPFSERQRDILCIFAEHVGSVIERAGELERLNSRNRELETANARLGEVNRLKDVFLSTASHELKTPLTSVIAYAELLTDHEAALAPDQRKEFLGRLRDEAERLLGLIEDILDLTRLETGKIELKRRPMLLSHLVHSAVETVRPMSEKSRIALAEDYDDGQDMVEVDEVKLRQAVVNLVVNAVKFSPEGGSVLVRTVRDEAGLTIQVTDQGPGVAPEDLAQIFTLFGQGLRRASRGTGGLGIGLHLVKRVVEMHGGEVGVTSQIGEGSTFWIRLPSDATASGEVSHAA